MKSIKKTSTTLILGLVIFAFPVLAGDMTAGSLVSTIPTTTETTTEKKEVPGFDTEIVLFFRGFFGKFFG